MADKVARPVADDGYDRRPTYAEIGRALGLSRQAVRKAAISGMPVESIEAAHAWRMRNLDPARRKTAPYESELRVRTILAQVDDLMAAAGDLLGEGREAACDALIPALREALRAVPAAARDRVLLHVPVFERMLEPVLSAALKIQAKIDATAGAAGHAEGPVTAAGADRLTDAEVLAVGRMWYAVAAGEPVQIEAASAGS